MYIFVFRRCIEAKKLGAPFSFGNFISFTINHLNAVIRHYMAVDTLILLGCKIDLPESSISPTHPREKLSTSFVYFMRPLAFAASKAIIAAASAVGRLPLNSRP